MARRQLFIITIVALALLTTAFSENRRIMVNQIRSLIAGYDYPFVAFTDQDDLNSWRDVFLNKPASLKNDWETQIARSELGIGDRVECAKKAVASGPKHPEVYAQALIAYTFKADYIRSEIDEMYSEGYTRRPKELDPTIGQDMVGLATEGARLDPDNAFFDVMKAYALFGLHRDAEALDCIRAASTKERYDSYRRYAGLTAGRYIRAAGFPEIESRTILEHALFPHLMGMRRMAYIIVWRAKGLLASGHDDEAEEILIAQTKIGKLMRKDATSLVEPLVGIAVQAIAGRAVLVKSLEPFRPDPKRVYKPRELAEASDIFQTQQLRIRNSMTAAAYRERGWNELADLWEAEAKSAITFRDVDVRTYLIKTTRSMVIGKLALLSTQISSSSLRMALILLTISGALLLVFKAYLSIELPKISLPGKLGLTVLTMVPWIVHTALVGSRYAEMVFNSSIAEYEGPMIDPTEAVFVLGAVVLYVGLAIYQLRRLSEPGSTPKLVRWILLVLTAGLSVLAVVEAVSVLVLAIADKDLFMLPEPLAVLGGMFVFLPIVGVLVLLIPAIPVLLIIHQFKTLPEVGNRWRLSRIIFLALSFIVPATVGSWIYSGGLHDLQFPSEIPAAVGLFLLFITLFTIGRFLLISRERKYGSIPMCLMGILGQNLMLLGKSLLVLYFVLLLIQLPLRGIANRDMRMITRSTVQEIINAPGQSAVKVGR